jgi:DNA-binding NarL/FixJ family response regulator
MSGEQPLAPILNEGSAEPVLRRALQRSAIARRRPAGDESNGTAGPLEKGRTALMRPPSEVDDERVIPAARPDLAEVLATAERPLVVAHPEHRAPEHAPGPVVLAAGPASGRAVLDAAFRAAADLDARLLAVRVRHDPTVELGAWLSPDRLAQWDAVTERDRRDLDSVLAQWRAAFPRVKVSVMVVDDDPVQFLEALSHRAALLVLGHPVGDPTRLPEVVTEALACRAHCPVMVVPE